MKTRFKRVFSLVLAVLMLVPIFSSFVFAKENVDVTNVPQNIASAADITVVEGLTWSGWKPENLVDGDATTGTYSPRGKAYAEKEVTNPTRVVTSSVRVIGGERVCVACKTKNDIPKEKIFDVVRVLKNVTVNAPVRIGDVLVQNVADTGVEIVATSNVSVK